MVFVLDMRPQAGTEEVALFCHFQLSPEKILIISKF